MSCIPEQISNEQVNFPQEKNCIYVVFHAPYSELGRTRSHPLVAFLSRSQNSVGCGRIKLHQMTGAESPQGLLGALSQSDEHLPKREADTHIG